LLPNSDQNISSHTHEVTENVAADKKRNIYDPCNDEKEEKRYVSEDFTLKMSKNISNIISDVVHALSKFQFTPSPLVIPAVEKPAPPMLKTPDIPGVQRRVLKQRKPKSRQEKLSEINYILGECKTTKPVNLKADFDKDRLLRPSGQQGTVARGRGLGEVMCVTKEALAYSEIAWKHRGVQGESLFEVAGKHDEAEQAIEPVHLDGKAEFIPDGKVALQGQFYYL